MICSFTDEAFLVTLEAETSCKAQPHSDCVTVTSFHLQPQFCSCVRRRSWAWDDPRPKAGPRDSLLWGNEAEASWHCRYLGSRTKANCAPSFSPSVGHDAKKQEGNSCTTGPLEEHKVSYFSWRFCLEETQELMHPFSYQPSDTGNLHSTNSRHRRRNNITKAILSKELYPSCERVQHCISTKNLLQSPRSTC